MVVLSVGGITGLPPACTGGKAAQVCQANSLKAHWAVYTVATSYSHVLQHALPTVEHVGGGVEARYTGCRHRIVGGRSGYSPEHMATAGDDRWSWWIKADGAVCMVPFNKVVCNNLLHILPCHRLVSICTQGAIAATGPQHKLEPEWEQTGLWRCCCVQ